MTSEADTLLTPSQTTALGRVLVADDEPSFLETTCEILREAGYEVMGADTAQSACELLAANQVDVLVTDIRMTGSADLDYLQSKLICESCLPVIVVTGYPSVTTAMKSVKLPVVAYLTKPLDIKAFLDEVRTAVGLRGVNRSLGRIYERTKALETELRLLEAARTATGGLARTRLQIEGVVNLLFSNLRDTLLELETLFGSSLQSGRISQPSGENFRPLALVELLQETVILLDRSKRDFKSKELAELRKRIEHFLKLPDNRRKAT